MPNDEEDFLLPPNDGHAGEARPNLTFDAAYQLAQADGGIVRLTTGGTRFVMRGAKAAAKNGGRAIVFAAPGTDAPVGELSTIGEVRARVYACCWAHRSTHYRTWCGMYTRALP